MNNKKVLEFKSFEQIYLLLKNRHIDKVLLLVDSFGTVQCEYVHDSIYSYINFRHPILSKIANKFPMRFYINTLIGEFVKIIRHLLHYDKLGRMYQNSDWKSEIEAWEAMNKKVVVVDCTKIRVS